ncbi:MAG: ABC transporter ATP-binding protein [Lachnospiraceae bacterium]|nr:ABC transporter ATP-binding protein [Lachnospiraceae bacterium]
MDTFKRLFSYAKERNGFMITALIMSAVATILSFVPYYYFLLLLKEITSTSDPDVIAKYSYIILGTTLAYALTYFLALGGSHIFAFRLETNMKKRGLNHLLDASFSFFDMNPSGKTRKTIDDNSGNTHTIIAHILPDSVNAVLFPICVIGFAFAANVYIGMLIVGGIIFALICFKFMYADSSMMKDYMDALEDINSETVEYVRGIQVIKSFDMVIESFEKLYRSIIHYSEIVNRQCQMCRIPFVAYQCGLMSFGAVIIAIAIRQAGAGVMLGEIISMVVFFISFVGLLNNAFIKIMFFSKNFQLGKDAVDRLDALFGEMDKNKLENGKISEISSFDIEFDHVSFEYEEGVSVLRDFNLKLSAGKKYALVGSSGGGKSTIAKLLSGFYPVTGGNLKIGGRDIREYTGKALEKNIAFVFQHSKLFKTSIYENVRIGKPESTREEVMKALELAMCNNILDKFESRENTVIGAEGVHLSGGEIQRIAIARAILKDAPIIVLDEASAASDPENEYEVQKAFSTLMTGKTVIMIAHRLSSIRNVDEILVIENGTVIERGSHKDLMIGETKYRRFQDLFNRANEWRIG